MAKKDYYSILGVDKSADANAIKSAYRKMAVKYHPDKQQGKTDAEKKEAEEKFKDVAEAYQVLSDPQKRQQYDTFGTIDENIGGGGFNPNDIFREFMRHTGGFGFGFGSINDDFFGNSQRQTKGTDIAVNVNFTLDEIYKLGQKTIKYDRYESCPDCNGTGSLDGRTEVCPHCNGAKYITKTMRRGISIIQQSYECPHCKGRGTVIKTPCKKCNGSGIIRKETEYTFNIPSGLTNNVSFSVSGYGNACPGGVGENGDLTIIARVSPINGFTINKELPYDIDYVMDVNVLDCITGTEKTIKYIDGKDYRVTIKPGATNGYTIKLRNLGLCYQQGNRGFLNVHIRQKMPAKLSKEEKSTLDKLKKSKNFK